MMYMLHACVSCMEQALVPQFELCVFVQFMNTASIQRVNAGQLCIYSSFCLLQSANVGLAYIPKVIGHFHSHSMRPVESVSIEET